MFVLGRGVNVELLCAEKRRSFFLMIDEVLLLCLLVLIAVSCSFPLMLGLGCLIEGPQVAELCVRVICLLFFWLITAAPSRAVSI